MKPSDVATALTCQDEYETPNRPTTEAGLPIYRIPEHNLPNLLARVAKLNKRAAKLKMDTLVLAEIGEEFETRRKRTDNTYGDTGLSRIVEYQVRFVLVTLTGNCPRVNGWAMAATIQHEDGGNILRTVPGFDTMLPLCYRTASTGCDHCHTDRRRNDTYVLQSETGDWKQVGRNCLADFLRTENAAGLAEMAEILAGLDAELSEFEDGEQFAGSATQYFSAPTLLTQVACCIRADGWCSRTEAKESYIPKQATVDQALMCFDPKLWAKLSAAAQEKLTPTEDDTARADAAIMWAQSLPTDVTNDYLWNVRVISHREQISYREAGLAGSIIAAYNRAMEKKLAAKYERDHPSVYFGTVGKREVFTLTPVSFRDLESQYGLTTLVMFRDAAGNRAKWFCSGSCSFDLDQPIIVKATVKAHEEYNGSRQTVLSRVAPVVSEQARLQESEVA